MYVKQCASHSTILQMLDLARGTTVNTHLEIHIQMWMSEWMKERLTEVVVGIAVVVPKIRRVEAGINANLGMQVVCMHMHTDKKHPAVTVQQCYLNPTINIHSCMHQCTGLTKMMSSPGFMWSGRSSLHTSSSVIPPNLASRGFGFFLEGLDSQFSAAPQALSVSAGRFLSAIERSRAQKPHVLKLRDCKHFFG